ncbi:hypothetical protein [Myxococcus sp. CA040A]|uniref:hypothetical protein n=1 Tax=Myxococcus sp. CA040A TaxID=2741738 RepID=UPI00157A31C8|nr:hypothetical protein [Myxococcus sp. CA040A]NTX08951.1 hypothetical protein [Myxococcus sp. CA040A]
MTDPYHFGPRLRGVAARALGLLHLTWDKCHGWPALLLRAPKDRPLPGAVTLLVTGYPDFVVAEHRAGRAELVPRVLDMVASAYEAALDEEQGRAHLRSGKRDTRPIGNVTMAEALPSPPARRFSWIPPALAAATLAALLLPWPLRHTRATASDPIGYTYPAAGMEDAYMTDMVEFDLLRMGEKDVRVLMPNGPMLGQDTPPCREPAEEVRGACWLHLKKDPPCQKNSVEYKGGCYFGLKGGKPMDLPPKDRTIRGRR